MQKLSPPTVTLPHKGHGQGHAPILAEVVLSGMHLKLYNSITTLALIIHVVIY
jgi:hypothetical protein